MSTVPIRETPVLRALNARRMEAAKVRKVYLEKRAADEPTTARENLDYADATRQIDEINGLVEDEIRASKLSAEYAAAGLDPSSWDAPKATERGAWLTAQLQQLKADGGAPGLRYIRGDESRALVGSGSTGGGAFTPADMPSAFFDRLAARSVALKSGIVVVRTDRDSVTWPRLTGDVTADWVAEAGTITSTDMAADQVTATPRKLAGLQRASNESLDDSQPQLVGVVEASLMRSVSLRFDLGVYEGTGTAPSIRGLKNVSGIQTYSMGTNGLALANLDPFAEALGLLAESNADDEDETEGASAIIVMHPRSWKALLKLKEGTSANNKPLLQQSAGSGSGMIQRSLYGVRVLLSSQLSITETQGTSSNASSAYVYRPDQLVAVIRNETRVEVDSSRLFNSDESEIRAIMRADLIVPNPTAVVRILGIIP